VTQAGRSIDVQIQSQAFNDRKPVFNSAQIPHDDTMFDRTELRACFPNPLDAQMRLMRLIDEGDAAGCRGLLAQKAPREGQAFSIPLHIGRQDFLGAILPRRLAVAAEQHESRSMSSRN
jgi:hypothetical protein